MTGPKRPGLAVGGFMLAAVCGCGNTYRAVVAPINPTGPAPQPQTYIAVVSQQNAPGTLPDPSTAGVATVLDFSGDGILAQAFIGPGPRGMALDTNGGDAYTINHDQTLSTFPVTASLMTKNVQITTLTSSAAPGNLLSAVRAIFLTDTANNEVDYLVSSPPTLNQAIPVGQGPVMVAGNATGQRVYAITQMLPANTCNTPAQSVAGRVYSIEATPVTVSNVITVGVCPVFGVVSPDNRRVFILNRGSGTVSVIDGQANQLLQTIDLKPSGGGGPVYAEIYQKASILVTANYDSNSVSFIDISTDVFGNNSSTFGTVLATVPVGIHPTTVAVLQDGTRVYTADQGDGSRNGTVSVVDMTSFKVKKTITIPADNNGISGFSAPRSVAAVSNALIGKVYVTSPVSPQVTVIRTDTDTITATVQLPGFVVELRAAGQTAGGGNTINTSRTVGSGTP